MFVSFKNKNRSFEPFTCLDLSECSFACLVLLNTNVIAGCRFLHDKSVATVIRGKTCREEFLILFPFFLSFSFECSELFLFF